jgi:hypothetical protein
MTNHLTQDETSAAVAGIATREVREHIQECAICRAETERLASALSVFRQSVRDWSLSVEPDNIMVPAPRVATRRWLGWSVALAACLIAGLTLPREFNNKPAPPAHTAHAISDDELLSKVNSELSLAVPPSMEPMALNQNRTQK